jgi:hypothetical protein
MPKIGRWRDFPDIKVLVALLRSTMTVVSDTVDANTVKHLTCNCRDLPASGMLVGHHGLLIDRILLFLWIPIEFSVFLSLQSVPT